MCKYVSSEIERERMCVREKEKLKDPIRCDIVNDLGF